MEKRTDDRDQKKSMDEATDDPRDANKNSEGEQAAELQVGEKDERAELNRFAPDSKEAEIKQTSPSEKKDKDSVDEP